MNGSKSAWATGISLLLIFAAWYVGRVDIPYLEVPLYLAAYIIGGYKKAKEGLETLLKEKDLDVDLLMIVAAAGAASIGYWLDGAILIFIFSLSGTLEEYTMEKTNRDIQSIMKLRPEEALVLQGKNERKVKVEELKKGDLVLVKPGERIPADGMVYEGISAVNQATITGESIPVDKMKGDEVFAGTINGQGALIIEVTKPAEATLLAQIIRLVQEAKSEKPPSQLFVERFEGVYAKAVVAGAILFMLIPPLLLDWTWSEAIYRSMIFLVVASPCALVASIMPAVLSGVSNGARKGILFKGGIHLENIGGIKAVAFDKTGTLTEGKPKITDIIPFTEMAEQELLRLTASLESLSEHPIARAIVQAAKDQELELYNASELQAVSGIGIYGFINGQKYSIGKLESYIQLTPVQLDTVKSIESQGKTVIFVETDQQILGILAVQDTLRPQAVESVNALKKMGVKVVLLTGDRLPTAQSIAHQAGIDEVYAELLPEQKVDIVKKLTVKYGKVAMIGDGVNDAPALAASSVGIAMGAAGTDVALETANIVLMADDLPKVSYAIALGRRTNRIIRQNLSFAIIVVFLLILENFLGNINLPIGVVGHEGSTLLVILNGLRLLR